MCIFDLYKLRGKSMRYARLVELSPMRCNKECLPFNTTLVLRGFIPGFSVAAWEKPTT